MSRGAIALGGAGCLGSGGFARVVRVLADPAPAATVVAKLARGQRAYANDYTTSVDLATVYTTSVLHLTNKVIHLSP